MSAGLVHCALVCLLVGSAAVEAYFTVPEVKIEAFRPRGLRVYINNIPGIKIFGFHGRKNDPIEDKSDGDIGGDVTRETGGRWIFENPNLEIAVGDIIYYWVYVQYNNLGYRKDSQRFEVKKLTAQGPLPPITGTGTGPGSPGVPSITTINNGKPTNKGTLIFEDNFNIKSLDTNKWTPEVRFPAGDREDEFVTYRNTNQNIQITENKLKITPTYFVGDDEEFTYQELDLGTECTTSDRKYCRRAPSSYDIISPITSGKITTKDRFSFKFGKIEIRTKLPRGDWVFPILYLEPKHKRYGQKGYASGIMRIAFSRGNENLFYNGEQLGNRRLSGGLLMGRSEACRILGIKARVTDTGESWGKDYHTYGLIWKPESITLTVDGKEYGTYSTPQGGFRALSACNATDSSMWTQNMSPFDEEFYISLGVGVGGVADFPDLPEKPWKNKRPQALLDFWTNREGIYAGWSADRISLLVDSVKVWAA